VSHAGLLQSLNVPYLVWEFIAVMPKLKEYKAFLLVTVGLSSATSFFVGTQHRYTANLVVELFSEEVGTLEAAWHPKIHCKSHKPYFCE